MKKSICLFILLLGILSACQKVENAEIDSQAEISPAPQIINSQNFIDLQCLCSIESTESTKAKWTYDNSAFWIVGENDVELFDLQDHKLIATYDLGEDGILHDVSPDGHTISYSRETQDIILYDVLAQQEIQRITLDFYYFSAHFSPNGEILAVVPDELKIYLYEVMSGELKTTLEGYMTAAPVFGGFIGADNKSFVYVSRGSVQIQDLASQVIGPNLGHEDFVTNLALSPNSALLATSAAGTYEGEFIPLVHIWDPKEGIKIKEIPFSAPPDALAFSPDSNLLAIGVEDEVVFWDINTDTELGKIDTDLNYLTCLTFSPDGSKLISCSGEGIIKIWEISK